MQDLDHFITRWRENLTNKTSLSSIEVDELEDHLRNEIKRLVKMGLPSHEACHIGRALIGSPKEITEDFDNLNPPDKWRDRLLWIIGGYIVFTLINSLVIRRIGFLASFGGQEIGLSTPWTIALTFVAMSAWIGLALAISIPAIRYLSARNKSIKLPRIPSWLTFVLLALGINLATAIGGTVNALSVKVFTLETLGTAAMSLSILQSLVVPMLLVLALAVLSRSSRSTAQ